MTKKKRERNSNTTTTKNLVKKLLLFQCNDQISSIIYQVYEIGKKMYNNNFLYSKSALYVLYKCYCFKLCCIIYNAN